MFFLPLKHIKPGTAENRINFSPQIPIAYKVGRQLLRRIYNVWGGSSNHNATSPLVGIPDHKEHNTVQCYNVSTSRVRVKPPCGRGPTEHLQQLQHMQNNILLIVALRRLNRKRQFGADRDQNNSDNLTIFYITEPSRNTHNISTRVLYFSVINNIMKASRSSFQPAMRK